jgi:hypothetical protein
MRVYQDLRVAQVAKKSQEQQDNSLLGFLFGIQMFLV